MLLRKGADADFHLDLKRLARAQFLELQLVGPY